MSLFKRNSESKTYENDNKSNRLRKGVAIGTILATLGLGGIGAKKAIDYNKAFNNLRGAENAKMLVLHENDHYSAYWKKKIKDLEKQIIEAKKQKPNTTYDYKTGENPWVVAARILEKDYGRKPTNAEILETMNDGFLQDNQKEPINKSNYREIKEKLPVSEWSDLEKNPNYVQTNDRWDASRLLKNTITKYNNLMKQLNSEYKKLTDQYKKGKRMLLEGIKANTEKYQEQKNSNENYPWWLGGAAASAVIGGLGYGLLRRRKRRDEDLTTSEDTNLDEITQPQQTPTQTSELEEKTDKASEGTATEVSSTSETTIEKVIRPYSPRMGNEETPEHYAQRLAKSYNKNARPINFESNRYKGPEREDLVKELLRNTETNDTKNGAYITMNQIAEMTGLSRNQVARLAKQEGIKRSEIQKEIINDRYKSILKDANEGLNNKELAEKHGYSVGHIRYIDRKYKLTRAGNLRPR